MNKAENHKYWSKKVAEFKKSGKTREEWCQKKNITIKQFTYWLKQFPEEPPETIWLPVEVKEENNNFSPLNIKIGAASIEIYPGYDKTLLVEILTTLKALC
jgi:hypothetical protein